jgi:DNA-nicking Smr family endonuclease
MSGGRKHRRHITPDEAKLWRAVTKDFVPLEPDREIGDGEAAADGAPSLAAIARVRKATPVPAVPLPPRPGTPPIAGFDPRRARRLSSGRLPIEAKLDLHGLRQEEARGELLGFLQRVQANGFRHVKVITGKGAPGTDDEDMRPFSLFDADRRGVLREQVPRWLSMPEFRALVVCFTVAGRGHGGGGALYIQVRKRPGR